MVGKCFYFELNCNYWASEMAVQVTVLSNKSGEQSPTCLFVLYDRRKELTLTCCPLTSKWVLACKHHTHTLTYTNAHMHAHTPHREQ